MRDRIAPSRGCSRASRRSRTSARAVGAGGRTASVRSGSGGSPRSGRGPRGCAGRAVARRAWCPGSPSRRCSQTATARRAALALRSLGREPRTRAMGGVRLGNRCTCGARPGQEPRRLRRATPRAAAAPPRTEPGTAFAWLAMARRLLDESTRGSVYRAPGRRQIESRRREAGSSARRAPSPAREFGRIGLCEWSGRVRTCSRSRRRDRSSRP
jgi:hypothetical protein